MTEFEKVKVTVAARELGFTEKTIYRMLERNDLNSCQDIVKNRNITLIIKDDKYYKILDEKIKNSSQDTDNDFKSKDILTAHYTVNENKRSEMLDIIREISAMSKYYSDSLKEYTDRVIESESQVKLITMTDNDKDNEIHELRARVKELEEKIKYYKSKWWNKII
jgi:undecaprenyl pyrophosphate synthase